MLERSPAAPSSPLRKPYGFDHFPSRTERRLYITKEELHTAHHEFGHWLVGFANGYRSDISMTPYGYSRARTMFYGAVDHISLSQIAAAGAVDTPYGGASGYGMDMAVVDYLTGGNGFRKGELISKAASIIASYPKEVRERVSEMIAFYGKNEIITSYMLHNFLERAREELIQEVLDPQKKQEFIRFNIPPKEFFRPNETTDRTLYETGEGFVRIVIYKKGKKVELISCAICGISEAPHNDVLHRQKENELA